MLFSCCKLLEPEKTSCSTQLLDHAAIDAVPVHTFRTIFKHLNIKVVNMNSEMMIEQPPPPD
jgi:CxxC motif-containing protein